MIEGKSETSTQLIGIARFKINKGQLGEFKRLSGECMEIARTKDSGTLKYDIYINEEKSEAVVVEMYKNSAALMEHLANNSHIASQIFKTGTVEGELLGDPSAEIRANLANSPVGLFAHFLSLSE